MADIGTKYLRTEGAFTYGALNVSQLSAADLNAISGSDRHTIQENGTITFQDSDGSTQLVSVGTENATIDFSKLSEDVLQKVADVSYLAQNTGVLSTDMNASFVSLGIDPDDIMATTKKDAILKAAGYNPGEQANFYGNKSANDASARILNEKWQQSAELQAKLDEEGNGEILVNNNVANSLYVAAKLSEQNIDPASTKAVIRTDYGVSNVPSGGSNVTNPETGKTEFKATTATADDGRHNMLEWDNLFSDKPKKIKTSGGTTISTPTQTAATFGPAQPVAAGNYNTGKGYAGTDPIVRSMSANNAVAGQGGAQGVSSMDFVPGTTNVQVPKPSYGGQVLQSGVSAVPDTIQARPNYTGTTMENLVSQSQGGFGGQKTYRNQFGQIMYVSIDGEGNALTFVPPGFYPIERWDFETNTLRPTGQLAATGDINNVTSTGGTSPDGTTIGEQVDASGVKTYTYGDKSDLTGGEFLALYNANDKSVAQAQYQGGMVGYALGGDVQGQLRLANKFLGYQGEATQESLNLFLNSNPGAAARMGQYEQAMKNMAQPIQKMYQGGQVQGFDNGGLSVAEQENINNRAINAARRISGTASPGRERKRNAAYTAAGGQGTYLNPTTVAPTPAAATPAVPGATPTDLRFTPYDEDTIAQYPEQNLAGKGIYNYGSGGNTKVFTPPTGFDFAEYQKNPTGYTVPGATPVVTDPGTFIPTDPNPYYDSIRPMGVNAIQQTLQPMQTPVNYIQPAAADFVGSTAGMTTAVAPMVEAARAGTVERATSPTEATPGSYGASTAATGVSAEVDKLSAQTGDKPAAITDEQQTTSAVTALDAATQDIFTPATNEYKRALTQDPITGDFTELVSGSANAVTAAAFTEAIQASTATPTAKATVAGQLAILMTDFEGGNTPAWASGSMRAATAAMAARGLGASSMAGQAIIQATMEAALPIAMADAQTQASFEAQNLSNRQARGMLAAQQRAAFMGQEFDQAFQARVQNAAKISDIANMNFTADQTIQLENSRNAQTLSLTNLSNNQAMVMAEAAALAGLDTQNLNNRQQAAVQNASNFLQVDMTNLTNKQQTAMFKTQQNVQALFTDQAAENASKQFNASSTNQTNQFFANLSTQTSQFNAAQTNAMDQFNLNAVNGLREFNANIQQQRDMFNAQNGLVIAQANAQWRQNLATINNATQNESNMDFAKTINGLTSKNIDAIWQRERDLMSNVNQSTESAKDRALSIIIADKELLAAKEALDYAEDVSNTQLLTRFLFPSLSGAGGLFSSV